jgi:glycosyltransferase involved in cell wall biosynthesis
MPRVTVLMSVWNGERFVGETIRSILGQTFEDFEFLILDNASTDRTPEVIGKFDDPRVKVVSLAENIGLTGALNLGLTKAAGRYVARIDADDLADPARLRSQVEFLESRPDVVMVGSWFDVIDDAGGLIGTHEGPQEHDDIVSYMLFENPFGHSTVMYEREAVAGVGGYNTSYQYAQDQALWWSLSEKGKLAILPKTLARIRSHVGQASRSVGRQWAEEPYEILEEVIGSRSAYRVLPSTKRKALAHGLIERGARLVELGFRIEGIGDVLKGIRLAPRQVTEPRDIRQVLSAILGRSAYGKLCTLKALCGPRVLTTGRS